MRRMQRKQSRRGMVSNGQEATMSDNATQNTDRELWREPPGDADPQFQKEYHEELARERAVNPAPAEGAPQSWEAVCRDVLAERVAQDQQWGGSTHDDNHRPDEWCLYIDKQRRLARDADDPRAYESRLIKIAALAVAAIQSSRRLNQPKAPGAVPAPAPGCPVTRNCHAGGNQSGEGARMSNTAEFKNPEPSPGDATHKWQPVHHRNYECCRVCGIIRRADRKNSACKGTTKMRPLESPTERA